MGQSRTAGQLWHDGSVSGGEKPDVAREAPEMRHCIGLRGQTVNENARSAPLQ